MIMKSGNLEVSFGGKEVSLQTTTDLLERLLGHFLYFRGQIERPLDQLLSENAANAKVELQYCERSTPYKSKGNNMFATPLNVGVTPCTNKDEFAILSEGIKHLDIHQEEEYKDIETPLSTKEGSTTAAESRRVLGKLQYVPVTPRLSTNQRKTKDSAAYLAQVLDQIKHHILNGWKIDQVVLLIGSTPMSPRESYIIDISGLSESNNEKNTSTDKGKCLRKIMQCLFMDSFLNSLPAALPLSNCYFYIRVERSCAMENPSTFFEPRLRFRHTGRGLKFTLSLLSGDSIEPAEGDMIYMAPSKPYRGVNNVTMNNPVKQEVTTKGKFLDDLS